MRAGLLLSVLVLGTAPAACQSETPELRSVPSAIRLDAERVEVPLRLDELGRPIVDVLVDGRPAALSFDLGASVVGLHPAAAARLGLVGERRRMFVRGSGAASAWRDIDVGRVAELTVGGAVLRDVEWVATAVGGPDGLLPLAALEPLVVALDGPGRRLVLSRGPTDDPGDGSVVDYRIVEGVPNVTVDLGGVAVEARLDSGLNSEMKVSPDVARRLAFGPEPALVGRGEDVNGPRRVEARRLAGALRLGACSTDRPWIVVDAGPAAVGEAFLARCVVTFDTARGRVRVAPSDAPTLR